MQGIGAAVRSTARITAVAAVPPLAIWAIGWATAADAARWSVLTLWISTGLHFRRPGGCSARGVDAIGRLALMVPAAIVAIIACLALVDADDTGSGDEQMRDLAVVLWVASMLGAAMLATLPLRWLSMRWAGQLARTGRSIAALAVATLYGLISLSVTAAGLLIGIIGSR